MTGKYDNDDLAYVFEAVDMRLLDRIEKRLYDSKPLTPDDRRDLANMLNTVLGRVGPIDMGSDKDLH